MATCIIYTFSGTGNSLLLANFLKEFLDKKGVVTNVYRITLPLVKEEIPSPNDYDYVGFSYPIHGFNTPKPFIELIKMLPPANGHKEYFIAKNSGEPFVFNSASSSLMCSLLKKKGYSLGLEHHFLLPYNIMFHYPTLLMKEMYVYCHAMAKLFSDEIIDNHHIFNIKHRTFFKIFSFFLRIEWLAGPINSKLMFVKEKRCIQCGKCLSSCPTNALYLNKKGKIKAKTSCAICMNCSFSCPTDAFFMGILNPWRVNFGGFKYQKLINDENLPISFIEDNKKGYFKLFKKYYLKEKKLLDAHNISLKDYLY